MIHKRVETVGVYPLVRPRGVSATPRLMQAKNSPPVRSEHAYAVRAPRSAGAEKAAARIERIANATRVPRLNSAANAFML